MIEAGHVERALEELFIDAPGATLRREDRKKSIEVAALLDEIARAGRRTDRTLVDAAAGKSYVGILAAALLGLERVVVIERDARLADAARAVARSSSARASVDVRTGPVVDASLWPHEPDVVVALHACGAASDDVLDASVRAGARFLLLVPCCYADGLPVARAARGLADHLGVPRHAEILRRFVIATVDAERALRLEAAGYDVTTVAFVAPTVTPHNLLLRGRRAGEPVRMREAAARLDTLHASLGLTGAGAGAAGPAR